MPVSWNEIRDRATRFARDWKDASYERGQAQSFWNEFFGVFGMHRSRVYSFEKRVEKLDGASGYIDCFWPGVMIAEHKSRGKPLGKAHLQALDYLDGLKDRELPRYIVVSDFERIRLYDLEQNSETEILTAELAKHVRLFGFIAGYQTQEIRPENPVNVRAAERMGKLHDQLKAFGYEGHDLEVLLVRLLFCMFADDTGIFQPAHAFQEWIEQRSREDGSDLGAMLARFFQVLNTPPERRARNIDEQLAQFPYVNGKLFEESIRIADFDSSLREALLEACALDWSGISPAVFGALFQSIMDPEARRNLGAHYTSEGNILKLIRPLFLDELRAEFEHVRNNRNKLFEFHKKLRGLHFFDPACGCGNFLVVAYRELRALELDVLRAARDSRQMTLDVHSLIQLDVDQFHGIEIEEFPAQIAQVALWLTDHQMNMEVGEEFGLYFARIPLTSSPHIVHGNALALDWAALVPPEKLSYLLGNPPFIGSKFMTRQQREELAHACGGLKGHGILDYVTAWYFKAVDYIRGRRPDDPELEELLDRLPGEKGNPAIRVGFVSTNSITQGEQVGVLWQWMLNQGMHIHFAHRTFQWTNEARGKAAVHCVIVGFGAEDRAGKTLYDYPQPKAESLARAAANINPYLVDAPDVVLMNRSRPICEVPAIGIGNKPIDGGNYLFTPDEREEFLAREPDAVPWFRRWIGSREFINGIERWCLWLGDCPPEQLRRLPLCLERVEAVRRFRLASKSAPTRKLADTPTRFHVENIPDSEYLVIPKVSSERRTYIPIGYLDESILASDLVFVVRAPSKYHFGVIGSLIHMAWVRNVCGRLESRYRYSAGIVYNNFPWPEAISDDRRARIEQAAAAVLAARERHPDATLADLYDPLTMPPDLLRAHQQLDREVDAAYSRKKFSGDADRVALLFDRYVEYCK
ncbi:MAG: SAM-dependent methyltransferase [Gammaproteobacteria bacterium HGW-Gammaproteobacteria-8]|nr:MAG: SAM-dependent methyltransferase [Gammaproteobacteria bacterium HGW-Gammaproteobacteria-8]